MKPLIVKSQQCLPRSSEQYCKQHLGESDMLKRFVLKTLNKLRQVKPDLVSTDDDWKDPMGGGVGVWETYSRSG